MVDILTLQTSTSTSGEIQSNKFVHELLEASGTEIIQSTMEMFKRLESSHNERASLASLKDSSRDSVHLMTETF
jgi:hypothetical protein